MFSRKMLALLILIAAIGFVLSVAVHLLVLLNIYVVGQPVALALTIGMLVITFATLLICKQVLSRSGDPRDFWRLVLGKCPRWIRK